MAQGTGARAPIKEWFLLAALVVAGLAGNHFKFPIFFGADLIFGSIFAMLALQLFGVVRGIAAALLISSILFFVWGHSYAVIIMTAEVAVVGWLSHRRGFGLIQADAIYWLCVGMPLVHLFYFLVMKVPQGNVAFIMAKDMLNGLANVLIARLVFNAMTSRQAAAQIGFREVLYNLMTFFVMGPALIMLALNSRQDFRDTEQSIRVSLLQNSQHMTHQLENWVQERTAAIAHLAGLASTLSQAQVQERLDQLRGTDAHFLRIGMRDTHSTITAYSPRLDELGQTSVGKTLAERPYIPLLRRTLKPMLAEVVMGRIGTPRPVSILLAPIVVRGTYSGYINGVLNLDGLRGEFDNRLGLLATHYTLVDKNGHVIMTNRTDQKVMAPFAPGSGTLLPLDADTSQWVPLLPDRTPSTERWARSSYLRQSGVGEQSEWRLILEQPLAPFQKLLFERYTRDMAMLILLFVLSLVMAEGVSRWMAHPQEELSRLTQDLPLRLATNTGTMMIRWPETRVQESSRLISNFKLMTDSLQEQFGHVRQANESLEQRVEERTRELQLSEGRYRSLFYSNTSTMLIIDPDSGAIKDANPAACSFYGWSRAEICAKHISEINTLSREQVATELQNARNEKRKHFFFNHRRASGEVVDVEVYSGPIVFGDSVLLYSIVHDISERKAAEAKLLIMAAELEGKRQEMEDTLSAATHDLRTPLLNVRGFSESLGGAFARVQERLRQGDVPAALRFELDPLLEGRIPTAIQFIQIGGQKLDALINGLLLVSRSGRQGLHLETVDMDDLLAKVISALAFQFHMANASVQIDGLQPCVADATALNQVFANLLDNALKYRHPGRALCIRVSGREEAGRSVYVVEDNGIGIDPRHQARIWNLFQRLDPGGTAEGEGLGLTLVHRLLSRMNGRAWVETDPNWEQGSRFCVELPAPVTRN